MVKNFFFLSLCETSSCSQLHSLDCESIHSQGPPQFSVIRSGRLVSEFFLYSVCQENYPDSLQLLGCY